jgi:O-antigen/teichoic acid export membrane protein
MGLRLFGKNVVVYAIGNVGLRAASFLLIPLYTHSLSINDFGLLMTLLLTIQFMLIAMNCGMRPALVRFAKEHDRGNQLGELLGTSCLMNIVGGLVVTGATLTFLVPFFRSVLHHEDVYLCLVLSCCTSLFQSLSAHLMAYYRARNEAIKFMIAGILAAGILFVTTYVLLRVFQMGIVGALLAKIATYAVIVLLVSLNILGKTGIRISFSLAGRLARYGFPLIFSMSGQLVMAGASVYFLSLIWGLEAVAIYSLGYKLATVLSIAIILPFQLSFQPYVFSNLDSPHIKKQISQVLTYLVLAMSAAAFCLLFCSRLLLPFIAPPEYSSAYMVIVLLLPGMAFVGMYYFAETLLTAVGKTHLIGLTMGACTIFSLMLNYVLILTLNWYGAVIASNVSLILVGVVLLIIGIRNFPVPIEWSRVSIAGMVFLGALVLNLALLAVDTSYYCWLSVAIGCAAAVILFKSGFFNDEEVDAVRSLILKLRVSRTWHENPDSQ